MQDGLALALLAVAVLLAAAVPTAGVVLVLSLFGRFVRRRRVAVQVLRRCDDCGRSWKAEPGRNLSSAGLRLRRWARRRARHRGADVPDWAQPQGWRRCPSCLSTRVRSSGEAITPAKWGLAEKAGAAATFIGFVLCLVAALALVT